ncbi:transporter [Ideonella sp. B508-1]|uniref:transporter n=1 Tax=Ideonella sp. B508-1 TaxID=137716 RepID=UPI0006873FCC|nr:transporter [Ideonella sp. B508-1]
MNTAVLSVRRTARVSPSALLSLLLAGLAVSAMAQSQPQAQPATPPAAPGAPAATPATGTDAARDALKTKEGDVSQDQLLKETLTSTEKAYSLLKTGQTAITYDLNYSYIGSETINVKFTDSTLTLFDIQNTRAHTVTNTFAVDYGVMDNLTATATLPLISRYSQSNNFSGLSNGLGDVTLGLRYQPFEQRRDSAIFTTTATLRLPTGRSPYTTIVGQNLATGSGNTALTVGANASQVYDPVAVFGSLNFTGNLPARNLSQQRDGMTLTEVRPGSSIGFGMGFSYALSYKVSTTMSLQETVSARSTLKFADGTSSKTAMQTSGMLNLGLGLRVSPKTTLNFTAGVGLTSDSPDFSLGMNMPLNF